MATMTQRARMDRGVRVRGRRGGARAADILIKVAWRYADSWRAGASLRRTALAALRSEGVRTGALSICVVGAREMRKLHFRYMGEPNSTDALTFDLREKALDGHVDGEVIVCADVALVRARSRVRNKTGRSRARNDVTAEARRELALYVVHGVLHLSGYDDVTPQGAARMHSREDELLTKLGIGAVFSAT